MILVKNVFFEQKVILLLVRDHRFLGTMHSLNMNLSTLIADLMFA